MYKTCMKGKYKRKKHLKKHSFSDFFKLGKISHEQKKIRKILNVQNLKGIFANHD